MQPLLAVAAEHVIPIVRLGELGDVGIKRDHVRHVGGAHAPHPHDGIDLGCARFCGCRP